MYVSVNWAINGSGNGLSPVRRQTITWSNAVYCQLDPWELVSVKFELEFYPFIQENAFENVAAKRAAILSRGRWVNQFTGPW